MKFDVEAFAAAVATVGVDEATNAMRSGKRDKLTGQTVRNWTKGTYEPRIGHLLRFCTEYGYSIKRFIS